MNPFIRSNPVRAELVEALPFFSAIALQKHSPSTSSGRTEIKS